MKAFMPPHKQLTQANYKILTEGTSYAERNTPHIDGSAELERWPGILVYSGTAGGSGLINLN